MSTEIGRRGFLELSGAGLSLKPAAPLFRIERVSEHVYAAVALRTPVVNGNSAIIVTRRGLVIVDAQSIPSAACALHQQFTREHGEHPVACLINTHHHLDHAQGNAAWLDLAGGQLDIVSTPFARAALQQSGRWLSAFLEGRRLPPDRLNPALGQQGYYAFVGGYLNGLRSSTAARPFFAEAASAPPALPNLTFDRRLTLHCGDLDVEVLHLGRGHTAGDAVVSISREGVVVTGDLIHGIDPLFFEAFPDEWPATLSRLAELDFSILIPGHGPVQRGKRMLRSLEAYLIELNQRVRAGIAAGKSFETLQAEITPARMRSLQSHGYLETIKRNRKDLLGLTDEPATAYGLAEVYRYFTRQSHAAPCF
jgi:glyoxylase-like metal-dependent hydrolase (beta-lactamase superfamily II)